jgi:stage II sporulation protein M
VFILGITAGALLAHRVDAGPDSAMGTYLLGYAELLRTGGAAAVPVWRAFLDAFLFPALALLSGLTLLGVAAIPLLLLVRGFMLSFSVTAFVAVFGIDGLWLALGELGLQCILGVPCLILLSVYGAYMALKLLMAARGKADNIDGNRRIFPRPLILRAGICAVLLTACALADAYLTPMLRDWIISRTGLP